MSLMKKILLVGFISTAVLCACLFLLYGIDDQSKSMKTFIDKARTICLLTESVRNEMEEKWHLGILTPEQMRDFAKKKEINKVVSMVPVVSAWSAAYERAEAMAYSFKVPKISPRNPKNDPDNIELLALKTMKENRTSEYVHLDKAANTVRFFRAVVLTESCLLCHGDPATSKSLWGNSKGIDPTGGKMENWKAGEIHGAFEVIQSLDAADAQRRKSLYKAGIVALAGIFIAMLIFFAVVRKSITLPFGLIIGHLNEGAGQVSEAASQVSTSSQTLAEGASDQAASIEQTSSSMEEMASMTRQNAENAGHANELVKQVTDVIKQANQSMEELMQSMQRISSASEETAQIIKTIDEIAFQTNLLALNAAVEAARAGQAGAGFSVVADEVRALAMRSAEAARDTAARIEETLKRVTEGTRIVDKTNMAFTEAFKSSDNMASLVYEISTASKEQSEGIDQVNRAISHMDKVVQSNAASAEESASSAEELNAQASTMRALMSDMAILISGKTKNEDDTQG